MSAKNRATVYLPKAMQKMLKVSSGETPGHVIQMYLEYVLTMIETEIEVILRILTPFEKDLCRAYFFRHHETMHDEVITYLKTRHMNSIKPRVTVDGVGSPEDERIKFFRVLDQLSSGHIMVLMDYLEGWRDFLESTNITEILKISLNAEFPNDEIAFTEDLQTGISVNGLLYEMPNHLRNLIDIMRKHPPAEDDYVLNSFTAACVNFIQRVLGIGEHNCELCGSKLLMDKQGSGVRWICPENDFSILLEPIDELNEELPPETND